MDGQVEIDVVMNTSRIEEAVSRIRSQVDVLLDEAPLGAIVNGIIEDHEAELSTRDEAIATLLEIISRHVTDEKGEVDCLSSEWMAFDTLAPLIDPNLYYDVLAEHGLDHRFMIADLVGRAAFDEFDSDSASDIANEIITYIDELRGQLVEAGIAPLEPHHVMGTTPFNVLVGIERPTIKSFTKQGFIEVYSDGLVRIVVEDLETTTTDDDWYETTDDNGDDWYEQMTLFGDEPFI